MPLIRHLQGQLATIRSQAQLHRVPATGKRERVESAGEAVGHNGESTLTPLRDQGQIAPIQLRDGELWGGVD